MIGEVMEEKGVRPSEIPQESNIDPTDLVSINQSWRYFKTKAFASFNAHAGNSDRRCPRTWKSAHAWCVLDLKEQQIVHKLSQDCQSCNGHSMPDFDRESVRKMAEFAVDLYLKRSGKKPWEVRSTPFDFDDFYDALDERPPHDEKRCEMCRKLGRSCWKK